MERIRMVLRRRWIAWRTKHAVIRAAVIDPLESRVLLSRALGIDVSSVQGTITLSDWQEVKSAGEQFVYASVSQGNEMVDPNGLTNLANASEAGLLVGAYHYATPSTAQNDAVSEANWFLSQAGQYIGVGYLRPVVGINSGSSMGATALTDWVNTFCQTVFDATGIDPVISCSTDYASNDFNSLATSHSLGIGDLSGQNPTTAGSPTTTGVWAGHWDFWLYSVTGSVNGISGHVDLDVYNGDISLLETNFEVSSTPGLIYLNEFTNGNTPNDIASGVQADWSKSNLDVTPTGSNQFLGQFGGGNNGILTGGYSWTSNPAQDGTSPALTLNGSTGYDSIGVDETLLFTGDVSVSAWVKFNNINNVTDSVILDDVPSGRDGGFRLGVSDGKVYFEVHDEARNVYSNENGSGGADLQTGTWYHLVGVFNAGTITTYVNGSLDRQVDTGGTMAEGAVQTALIGRERGASNQFLNATIDDVQVFNTALNSDEAAVQQPDTLTSGLIAYWKFDEGSGTRTFDSSNAAGVTLTLSNLPVHDNLSISFDLYILRTWDGRAGGTYGPDIWSLTEDLQSLLYTTFANGNTAGQSYPGSYTDPHVSYPIQTGAIAVDSLGYTNNGNPDDATYHLSFSFPHTSSSVIFDFAALKMQGLLDESWGIDNITVRSSDLTVTNTADDGRPGSLRWAIGQANAAGGNQTIVFDPSLTADGPATIALSGSPLDLHDTSGTLTIDGPGANLLTIDAGGTSGVFTVDTAATIEGLTITDGSDLRGGGIDNGSALIVEDCTISGNHATYDGGGIYSNGGGGGLVASLDVINS
ncbi:MAG TPA: LamG-like jellyroll fold domain-containing protein, partial [Tepidisphaeraceae bacterium]|nr:LamG-like jellyroll fold domain-containing protein [Tepidisphaeraceae bacterium]